MTRTTSRQSQGRSFIDPRSDEFTRSLGERLVARRLIDDMALARAVRARAEANERLDRVLSRLGLVDDRALTEVIGEILDLPVVDRRAISAVEALPGHVDAAFLRKQTLLPLSDEGGTLDVAVGDPFNKQAIDALAYLLDRPVNLFLAPVRDIERAFDRLAAIPDGDVPVVAEVTPQADDDDLRSDTQRLRDLAAETPIIRMVQTLIVQAVEARASDVHIEPGESGVRVRYRIDGMLHTIMHIPPQMRAAVVSRIKIMAHLDIAEQRLPQDGRCQTSVSGHTIDLRISSMPTANGESIVMRILDRQQLGGKLAELGFALDVSDQLMRLLAQPTGIILVTGPTGSGKTTTLYSALSRLDAGTQKIVTVEDPIEYLLPGISQIQVQPRIGLSFASALRSILRQDPDVIMVGEIRDIETAEMAIQAALTGHLVLSTVHTNSAAATITRLIDMGIERYLLGSTIIGVLAQRLLRKLCPHCSAEDSLGLEVAERLCGTLVDGHGSSGGAFRRRVGCPSCRNTGYAGRLAIGEVMTIGPDLRSAIVGGASEDDIESLAIKGGMRTLARDGLLQASAGATTIEEILRVTRME